MAAVRVPAVDVLLELVGDEVAAPLLQPVLQADQKTLRQRLGRGGVENQVRVHAQRVNRVRQRPNTPLRCEGARVKQTGNLVVCRFGDVEAGSGKPMQCPRPPAAGIADSSGATY